MTEFKPSSNNTSTTDGPSGMMDTTENPNPVDLFEQSFQACLAAMTKEDTLSNLDRDEIKVDAELTLQNFIESARAMEGYFLKKRLQIAAQKPELLVKDDTSELRLEMMRKDELLKKNYEKMAHWQNILADLQSSIGQPGGTVKQVSNVPGGPPSVANPGSVSSTGGPATPLAGRPQTPSVGSVGRPQTPAGSTTPQSNTRMLPSPNVGYYSPMSQQPQQQQQSGLQGPLANLERAASTIGMNENR